jgi:hypothetical protein
MTTSSYDPPQPAFMHSLTFFNLACAASPIASGDRPWGGSSSVLASERNNQDPVAERENVVGRKAGPRRANPPVTRNQRQVQGHV